MINVGDNGDIADSRGVVLLEQLTLSAGYGRSEETRSVESETASDA